MAPESILNRYLFNRSASREWLVEMLAELRRIEVFPEINDAERKKLFLHVHREQVVPHLRTATRDEGMETCNAGTPEGRKVYLDRLEKVIESIPSNKKK